MITSFKLPDLVLGVNIRADVTGARAAARQLRNAVASEFARAGGLGLPGMGGGAGAAAGASTAAVLGGSAAIASTIHELRAQLNTQLDSAIASLNEWKKKFPGAFKEPTGEAFDAASFINPDFKKRSGGMRAGQGKGSWQNSYERVASMGLVYNRSLKVWVPATKKAAAKAVGEGTQLGLLQGLKKALCLWHFLIGGLIVGLVVGGAKRMMGPALQYIRNTGTTTGRYGAFSNAMEATPSALRNVSVQFGLMAIELFNLDEALQDFNRILVQMGSVLGWLGEQKWLMWFIKGNPNLVLSRLVNFALGKLPTGAGGVDLGAGGLSNRLSPAALQGSVQAYSILQGNLMNYALQTARNTKQTVDALNKIIERAPAMGVVNP